MKQWKLPLPMSKPLSLNGREHWRVKAKRVREVRDAAAQITRHADVPALKRITVELHYVPRDKRRRDPLNLVATLKPVEDGIVDAGVIPDDTPQYLQSTLPIIESPNGKQPELFFIIRELEDESN